MLVKKVLMPFFMVCWFTLAAASAETFRRNVAPLIEASCVACHDSDTETGFNLEALGDDLTDAESFRAWEKVFDRVKDGEMPPVSSILLLLLQITTLQSQLLPLHH